MSPKDARWDLRLREGQLAEGALYHVLGLDEDMAVEVKSEPEARTHVYVETASHGQPSGIMTTEAAWWGYEVLPDRWVLIKTRDLIRLVTYALDHGQVERRGGDGGQSMGVPIPKAWLVGVMG